MNCLQREKSDNEVPIAEPVAPSVVPIVEPVAPSVVPISDPVSITPEPDLSETISESSVVEQSSRVKEESVAVVNGHVESSLNDEKAKQETETETETEAKKVGDENLEVKEVKEETAEVNDLVDVTSENSDKSASAVAPLGN